MLITTNYTVTDKILQDAIDDLPKIDSRLALNEPTGSFFNDPWVIKPEFVGTVWETILDSLAEDKGEARLIKLAQGVCYPSHADIDDRWHLSIDGDHSYLIDLETNTMHQSSEAGRWYLMDAGVRHSAANFGSKDRIQLVVRKLLVNATLQNPVNVVIKMTDVAERRFIFDDLISPWANRAYKRSIISYFKATQEEVHLTIEESCLPELQAIVNSNSNLILNEYQ